MLIKKIRNFSFVSLIFKYFQAKKISKMFINIYYKYIQKNSLSSSCEYFIIKENLYETESRLFLIYYYK